MSFLGGAGRASDGDLDSNRQPVTAYYEERRTTRSERLCGGTLACDRCDAPIAIGSEPLSLTEALTCPYCGRRAPARAFLSLAAPPRPARVAVRVSRPASPPRQPVRRPADPAREPRRGGWGG